MSFRAVRNIGLGIMSLTVVLISLLSYQFMSVNVKRLETVITVEEVKLRKWHVLSEIIADARDSLSDYYSGRREVIALPTLLIKKAFDEIADIKRLSAGNEAELAKISEIIGELKVFKQSVYAFGSEGREGYRGGASANEMGRIALKVSNNIVRLNRDALEDIELGMEEQNRTILETTKTFRRILGLVLVVFVFSAFKCVN